MKNVSELCLKIDNAIKKENVTYETYKQILQLLDDIIKLHNEKVGYIDDILKQVYLDIANNYDASDLSSKSDIIACVASEFREKVHDLIN